MAHQDKFGYKTTIEDDHLRDEEFQWSRILSAGDPARGMVLLYLQKACTAFHEFEPAFKQGTLEGGQIEFFRRRLATRIGHVLTTMRNNGLDKIEGAAALEQILRSVESAKTLERLAELTEDVHAVNHTISDSLEGR